MIKTCHGFKIRLMWSIRCRRTRSATQQTEIVGWGGEQPVCLLGQGKDRQRGRQRQYKERDREIKRHTETNIKTDRAEQTERDREAEKIRQTETDRQLSLLPSADLCSCVVDQFKNNWLVVMEYLSSVDQVTGVPRIGKWTRSWIHTKKIEMTKSQNWLLWRQLWEVWRNLEK